MEEFIVGLSIDDKEEETIQLGVESSEREISYANRFVGMFLTSSVINFMISMLANVWHPIEGVSILDLGNGRFLFRFYFEVDVDRIEKMMLMYDIPYGFMFDVVAKQLGSFIGVFLKYGASDIELRYRRIMGIRVQIDVRKSLKKKKKLAFLSGPPVYVRFEYEKLTLFCFLCEKLGHGESFARLELFLRDNIMTFNGIFLYGHSQEEM
ncbi:hypothetical protein J1N35_009909 [Gossypium stocksii]|uniref:Zinc knuckle CX2CX4HX4C domain-containing protein n=1 Tax=Gossypium stocksii TaxID=47602 RepID=A0A9D4AC90_9ROSI|nr:hypothetical protein J1N35_009909 [Gossypium stocksii]